MIVCFAGVGGRALGGVLGILACHVSDADLVGVEPGHEGGAGRTAVGGLVELGEAQVSPPYAGRSEAPMSSTMMRTMLNFSSTMAVVARLRMARRAKGFIENGREWVAVWVPADSVAKQCHGSGGFFRERSGRWCFFRSREGVCSDARAWLHGRISRIFGMFLENLGTSGGLATLCC
jgi:hypothetical protein